MIRLLTPALRLIIAPAAVAAFAALDLWDAGTVTALGAARLVFGFCVFAIATWGRFQLERTRRELQTRTQRRSRTTP